MDDAMSVNVTENFNTNTVKAIGIYAPASSGASLPLGDVKSPTFGPSKRRRGNTAAAKRVIESDSELQALPELFLVVQGLGPQSVDWNARLDALTRITDAVTGNWEVLRNAGILDNCLDRLLERLEDGSLKVVQHALVCLQRVREEAPVAINSSQAAQVALIPALVGASASTNRQISVFASSQLSSHLSSPTVPVTAAVTQLCAAAIHEKDRLRCAAFRSITEMIVSNRIDASSSSATVGDGIIRKYVISIGIENLYFQYKTF